jgi:hypothetical protein
MRLLPLAKPPAEALPLARVAALLLLLVGMVGCADKKEPSRIQFDNDTILDQSLGTTSRVVLPECCSAFHQTLTETVEVRCKGNQVAP